MKTITILAALLTLAANARGQTNQPANPATNATPVKYSLTPNYEEISRKLDSIPRPAKFPWVESGSSSTNVLQRPRVEYGGAIVQLFKPKKQGFLKTFSLRTPIEEDNRTLYNEYAHGPGRLLPYALSSPSSSTCVLFSAGR